VLTLLSGASRVGSREETKRQRHTLLSVTPACQRSCSRTWWCSTYPCGFCLGALALFINYFAKRFSLRYTIHASRLGWSHRGAFCMTLQNNSTLIQIQDLDSYSCNIDSVSALLKNVRMEEDFEHVDNDVDMEALYYSCSLAALV